MAFLSQVARTLQTSVIFILSLQAVSAAGSLSLPKALGRVGSQWASPSVGLGLALGSRLYISICPSSSPGCA